MTFDEIVDRVSTRLNLTGAVTIGRIGLAVNERYQRLSADVGLNNVARTAILAPVTIGQRLFTITGLSKVYTLYDASRTPPKILQEITVDQLIHLVASASDDPHSFAVYGSGPSSVTIGLNCVPITAFQLSADGDAALTYLSGTDQPNFPAKFHDILVYGAMANELEHMEKYDMAARQEQRWDQMLSQLRLYFASSAYLDIRQGRAAPYMRRDIY